MRKYCLLILFFSLAVLSQEVKVYDRYTNEPLEGVSLHVSSMKSYAITDKNGVANVKDLVEANKIYVRLLGYETQILSYRLIESNKFIILLTADNNSLNEVVLSASKWEESRKMVPNVIISQKEKDIILNNPQTSADLLSQSGKVFVQKSQLGGGSPIIRGFATNRVLLNVDGIRMNNAIFRSGNVQNVISIDPNSIQNTEIILGPGTMIYGSDAIGGVMNFYTFQPTLSSTDKPNLFGAVVSRWSSANQEKMGHFDVNIGFKKWAFLTSYTLSNFEDLSMGKFGPADYLRLDYIQTVNNVDAIVTNRDPRNQVPTGYSQTNIIQKVKFRPNELWDLTYALHYSNTTDFARYDQLLRRNSNGNLRFAEWFYGPQKWVMNHFVVDYNAANRFFDRGQFNFAYQHFEESRNSRTFQNPIRTSNVEKVDAYSVNFDFLKKFNQTDKITYGCEYIFNVVQSYGFKKDITTSDITTAPSRYPDGSTWQSLAAYIQYEKKWSNQLVLQTGLRYNQILLNATFDPTLIAYPFDAVNINNNSFTGSAGLSYQPQPKTTVFTNFSTAFRAPNVDDIGKTFESTPSNFVVPNPELNFEYAYNGEIGFKQQFGKSFLVDASFFYTLLDNAMVRRDYTFNGESTIIIDGETNNVQAIQNAAFAKVYGIQGGLTVYVLPILQWKSTVNWNQGTEELDNGDQAPLRHAAPLFGSSNLLLKTNNWTFDATFVYTGTIKFEDMAPSEIEKSYLYAKDANGNPYAPNWYTINLKAMFTLNKTWSFTGGIENITDQLYRSYSSGISAPGRNFVTSLRVNF